LRAQAAEVEVGDGSRRVGVDVELELSQESVEWFIELLDLTIID